MAIISFLIGKNIRQKDYRLFPPIENQHLFSRRQQQNRRRCDCSHACMGVYLHVWNVENSKEANTDKTLCMCVCIHEQWKKKCTAPPPFTTILASFQSYVILKQFISSHFFIFNFKKFVSFIALTFSTNYAQYKQANPKIAMAQNFQRLFFSSFIVTRTEIKWIVWKNQK